VFKTNISLKRPSIQYDDDGTIYTIYAFDGPQIFSCVIWKGAVPESVINGGYSQAQNDTNKTDFESNYKPYANRPVNKNEFDDPRFVYRFGNLTATSTSEVLISARAYNEQGSQAQRSVKSSSANDSNPSGSGAKEVMITYLDSNYVLKTENILLNGTTAVATVATDIRFIEDFKVIKGAATAGAVELWSNNNGTGTAICGIPAASDNAFLCHHYVPAGQRAVINMWGVTVSDEANVKLKGQARFGENLVDTNVDLDNLIGIAAATRLSFSRQLEGVFLGEKTYIRITVVPQQGTSTVIRSFLDIWEDKS
jgi:hypothetical protein